MIYLEHRRKPDNTSVRIAGSRLRFEPNTSRTEAWSVTTELITT